jgi:hypothetical protein
VHPFSDERVFLLVVCLPSLYKGGDLVVYHEGNEKVCPQLPTPASHLPSYMCVHCSLHACIPAQALLMHLLTCRWS